MSTSRQQRLKWAIVGVGTAGRARARAIDRDERSLLVAVHRGRYAEELEVPVKDTFEAAIAPADCVAICSPSAYHADQVRQVLEAGKHAIVEYPLAPTGALAKELFTLARSVGRILHVEHIELLTSPAKTLKALVRPAGIEHIDIRFEGRGAGDEDQATLAQGNVARLHRSVDLAGGVRAVRSVQHEPGTVRAELVLRSGVPLTVVATRGPDLARRTHMTVRTAQSTWEQINDTLLRDGTPQTLLGVGSLFKRDHDAAVRRILDGEPHYVRDGQIVHVLEVTDAIANGRTGPLS